MYSTLCVDTDHDVTTFEVDEIVSNIKKKYLKRKAKLS